MKKIPPPLLAAVGIGLEWLLDNYIPIVKFGSVALSWAGYIIIIAAVGLAISAVRLFASSRTTLAPHKHPDKFVASGPYKFSRNPMYLAITGQLIGIAVVFGGLSGFIVPVVFVGIITKVFIAMEETNMSAKFGDEYGAYCRQMRRWI